MSPTAWGKELRKLFPRPSAGRSRAKARPNYRRPHLEVLEDRRVLSTFSVLNTNGSGPGSFAQAVLDSNANPDLSGAANQIVFNIPANDARHFYYRDDGAAGQVSL